MWRFSALVVFLLAAVFGDCSFAQVYPTKPVKLVIGNPPGGTSDVVGRLLARKLTEKLGQPVVVDNRAGSAGNIAAEMVSRSAADGYTLLLAASTQAVNPSFYPNLSYDLVKDFTPVSLVATSPSILAVHPSVPATTVRELIALAKGNPGKLTYASAGNGSATHLAGELFKALAGIDLVHVPYKGAGPAMNDVLAGYVLMQFGFNPGQVMSYAKSGRLRALAVTSERRLNNIPDLPTMQEAGVEGYEASTWWGVLAPAGTPKEVVSRLNSQTHQAVSELTERLVDMGIYPLHSTPEQFASFLQAEIAKWARIVKLSGARID